MAPLNSMFSARQETLMPYLNVKVSIPEASEP